MRRITSIRIRVVIAAGIAVLPIVVACDGEPASATSADCEIVKELSAEFRAMDGQDQTGGDVSARFAEKVRAAAAEVSGKQLRDELNSWADGFSALAEVQRTDSSGAATGDEERTRMMQAGDAIYGTADELRSTCPDAWPTAER